MPLESFLISEIADFSRDTIKNLNWEYVDYLDTGSIAEDKIESFERYYDLSKLPSRAKKIVKQGDIIFSTVRPINRHYGRVNESCKNVIVSTGFSVIRANEEFCLTDYLYYLLTQDETINLLQSIAEQSVSTYPSINDSDIGNISVGLPPLPIQQKIINIVEPINEKIRNNQAINDNLGGASFAS